MTSGLTVQERRALASVIGDDLGFISRFMEIPDKQRRRRPFVPWPVQRRLIQESTNRNLVIKDAQIGCTSIITALFMKHTMTTPDTTTIIVSHEEFLTQRLLHRAQVFYDSVPDELKPRMDHQSSFEKRFPDINSVMYIGTARSQVFGRGEPIHRLLLSEEAFYVKDAISRIILPALQRVPPDGIVYRESTPNGEDGSFYEEVQLAMAGQSSFKLHTLYWWENPDNSLRQDSETARQNNLHDIEVNEEERVLQENHGLNVDQIRWRRWKILEMGAMFYQEHMESLDTCFLTIGEPHYDPQVTTRLSRNCFPAPHAGPEGARVWFQPEAGGYYVMGIDPGQGKQTESVAHIWRLDLEHLRHEATLSGFHEPKPMAQKCMSLGRYYNNALAVPEANAHGLALIGEMIGKYPHMYHRRDIVSGRAGPQPGWYTSAKTKPFMMQELTARLPALETYDAEFVRQIRGFRDIGMGKVETISADDHHDAGCLALVGATSIVPGRRRGFQGRSGWSW